MWVFLIMRYIFAEVEAEQNYAHNTACTYCWFYHSTAVQLTRAYMHACVCMYSCVFVHMFVCVCVCVMCAIYYVLKPHKKIFVNSHTCMESKTDMSMICLSLSLRCIQACPTQDDAGQRGSFKGTPEGHRQTKMSHRAWCHTHAVFSSMEETSMNSPVTLSTGLIQLKPGTGFELCVPSDLLGVIIVNVLSAASGENSKAKAVYVEAQFRNPW